MQASRSFGMIERDAGDTLQAENEGVVGYQIPLECSVLTCIGHTYCTRLN